MDERKILSPRDEHDLFLLSASSTLRPIDIARWGHWYEIVEELRDYENE